MQPITRLPPLGALRVLEAIESAGSIMAAAKRLNLSHSAVSHQVAILEDWSPTQLFVRRGRRTELTAAGRSLAETTREAFNSIRHEVDRLPLRGMQTVSIGAIPMVAQTWLTSVLPDLTREMPDIPIHVGLALFDRPARIPPNIIISFAHRERLQPGDRILFGGDAAPVCAPQLLEAHGGDPEAVLRSAPRIHDEDSRLWRNWNAMNGDADGNRQGRQHISIEESSLIRAATVAGLGVGVCRLAFVQDDIRAGRILRLSEKVIDRDFLYFLRRNPATSEESNVARVVSWLVRRARSTRKTQAQEQLG